MGQHATAYAQVGTAGQHNMNPNGYIQLKRGVFANSLWHEKPFSRSAALVDLCGMASWREKETTVKGVKISVPVGCVTVSVRGLARRWGWTKSTVERYITRLITETLAERVLSEPISLISLAKCIVCRNENFPNRDSEQSPTGTAKESGTLGGTLGGVVSGEDAKACEEKEISTGTLSGTATTPYRVFEERNNEEKRGAGCPGLEIWTGKMRRLKWSQEGIDCVETWYRNLAEKNRAPTAEELRRQIEDALRVGEEAAVTMMAEALRHGWVSWYYPTRARKWEGGLAGDPEETLAGLMTRGRKR